MNSLAANATLEVAACDNRLDGVCQSALAGDCIKNLLEDHRYRLATNPAAPQLYVDDVPLQREADGSYRWSPSLYAGRVSVVATDASGNEYQWWLDVSPSPAKLGQAQLDDMVRDIRDWQAEMLQGTSAALLPFGMQGANGRLSELVTLSRLSRYGRLFLEYLQKALREPRQILRSTHDDVPIAQVRRLHHSSLRDRRLIAALLSTTDQAEETECLSLRAQTIDVSLDSPAHRTLKRLLVRFISTIQEVATLVREGRLGEEEAEQRLRQPRRLGLLEALIEDATRLLRNQPLSQVTRAENSAAGLTQVAANPAYSRAYRAGTQALRTGVDGENPDDLLHVSPTWGIYETWCFAALTTELQQRLDATWAICEQPVCSGDLALSMKLPDGRKLEAIFQATFPSELPAKGRLGWSLSRERRPDILLVLHESTGVRSMVLDAKYRSGRSNVLDAMASAHIYHDSLRLAGTRPEPCLLVLPGAFDIRSITEGSFISDYGVGAIHEMSSGRNGVGHACQSIVDWVGTGSTS